MNGLTVSNYKEPLDEIPEGQGYGYYGTLIQTTDGSFVQCHICGNLYKHLGLHVRSAHQMSSPDYREQFQLASDTSLVSDQARQVYAEQTLKYLGSLSKEQKEAWHKQKLENLEKGRGAHETKHSLETLNKRGHCPSQVLSKIKEVADKLGHAPSLREMYLETGSQRYRYLAIKIFGSWNEAIKMLGYAPNTSTHKYHKLNGTRKKEYETEELLQYIKLFVKTNNRIPRTGDFLRGDLPDINVYTKRFGSLAEAREAANVS